MSPATEQPHSPADYAKLAEDAWFEGFRARAEGDHTKARRHLDDSARFASIVRRLDWIPEARAHG